MIRRVFVRALSGAVFSCLLGVKVETWKLEEDRLRLLMEGHELGVLLPAEYDEMFLAVYGESPFAPSLRALSLPESVGP